NMIGILKALGTANWGIRKIFLYYAAYIVILGLFWGNLIGIGLCLLQDRFEFITLSEENYYLSTAPIDLNFWPILLLNLGTLAITLFFLIIPSYLVTSISPVKAIRFK
ncbi:MAG: FtsX-like permease family protein, partial [Phaeodactylibacter sp.]|nr:FtsX-like permease family protein [Phaeodactylibacter sp.]